MPGSGPSGGLAEGINHRPAPALRFSLFPRTAEPLCSGPRWPEPCLSFPTGLGAAGRVAQPCAPHSGPALGARHPPSSDTSQHVAWNDPARSPWWPGWAGTDRAAAQEPGGAGSRTPPWHPSPACWRGGCCPWHLPAPPVPREDLPGPQGHRSPGSKGGHVPCSPRGDTRQRGDGAAASIRGQGPRRILASPRLVPGGTVPWPDVAPVWNPPLWPGGQDPSPLGALGVGGGPCPGCQPAPESHPVPFPSGAGRAGARTEAALCGVPKASRARQPGRLPLPRSCLPVPRSFLLRLSSPDVPLSPLPWHPGSTGPGRRDVGEPFAPGSAAGLYVTVVAGGSPSSPPRPRLPSQTSPFACRRPSAGWETEARSRALRAGEWRWAGAAGRSSGAGAVLREGELSGPAGWAVGQLAG